MDFGQQLYIPWRLASGERLYRDIALLHGPLSQHVNAILFKIFGASFTVLIFANLVVLAVITALVYRFFQATADRLTATTACLLLLATVRIFPVRRNGQLQLHRSVHARVHARHAPPGRDGAGHGPVSLAPHSSGRCDGWTLFWSRAPDEGGHRLRGGGSLGRRRGDRRADDQRARAARRPRTWRCSAGLQSCRSSFSFSSS